MPVLPFRRMIGPDAPNRAMNLAQLLAQTALRYPDKPALIFEDRTWTYRAFDQAVARHAALLQQLGVTHGDRVALQLPKQAEFLFFHLALLSLGAITLPLNPDFRAEEVAYFLADSQSALFITDQEHWKRVQGSVPPVPLLLVEGLRLPEPLERTYPTTGEDIAMICYTSGTTGRSKGAMLSHRNLIVNMQDLAQVWAWTDQDVLLHVLPLFHVHGLNVATHGSLYAGATLIMHAKFDPVRVWQTLASAPCTQLMGVPTMYQRLLRTWEQVQPDLGRMRVFISGSAPLAQSLFERFEQTTGFRILERYGMTETGMNASNPLDSDQRLPASVGFPLPSTRVRIVDPAGDERAPDEVGEVWLRGPHIFEGYWQMPEKTQEAFKDGWFRSGDLGFLDGTGRLWLVGRAKELIISGGFNVYPKEIENVLESHLAVREAAVVGLPDEDLGEQVVAVVVLSEEVLASTLIAMCKERLARYKCPRRVVFIPELPHNAMGKIQKQRLVQQLLGS